ncbi:MAG: hypothetical protein FJ098_08420, partial [Deltaproteobacteria bacterium]|nr:hypothetical protein [Deltaproteobacteria bacterium]
NHASEFSRILCETEDSGELVVDATLVAALLEGWHPVWAWSLARRVSRGADVDGTRIGLGISSSVGCMW